MTIENIIKKTKIGILLAGALLSLNSCSNLTMKGFDKINGNEMPKEKLIVASFEYPLEYDKIKNVSEGKYGTKVFEYILGKENSEIIMIKDEKKYRVTNFKGYDGEPKINAEETAIVFTSDRDNYLNIYMADLKNEELVKVTNNREQNYEPSIDANGTKIAYTQGLPEKAEVYLINLEKNESINISNDEMGDYYTSISGDGNRVGFVSERKGSSVYVKDVKTKELILVDNSYELWYHDLKLNYDGTRVTYGGKLSTSKNGTIFFKDLESYKKLSWPLNKGYDGEPSIDSSGNYISWISRQTGIYEREQKKRPLEEIVKHKIIKVVKTDNEGEIKSGILGNLKLENKKAEPKIKIADTKTGYVQAIENQILKDQMGDYISVISSDGKTITIINKNTKEENYQIKNPLHIENKEIKKTKYKQKSLIEN
ncbi:MAG: hypothetical protein AABX80_02800 [Nanoarchaeota archaeon]